VAVPLPLERAIASAVLELPIKEIRKVVRHPVDTVPVQQQASVKEIRYFALSEILSAISRIPSKSPRKILVRYSFLSGDEDLFDDEGPALTKLAKFHDTKRGSRATPLRAGLPDLAELSQRGSEWGRIEIIYTKTQHPVFYSLDLTPAQRRGDRSRPSRACLL